MKLRFPVLVFSLVPGALVAGCSTGTDVSHAAAPSRMRDEANGGALAIAIAPGVWTALAPGASVLESATYGTRFGYCASIKAYESKFTVERVGNSCW